jgi:hypothetical protein
MRRGLADFLRKLIFPTEETKEMSNYHEYITNLVESEGTPSDESRVKLSQDLENLVERHCRQGKRSPWGCGALSLLADLVGLDFAPLALQMDLMSVQMMKTALEKVEEVDDFGIDHV